MANKLIIFISAESEFKNTMRAVLFTERPAWRIINLKSTYQQHLRIGWRNVRPISRIVAFVVTGSVINHLTGIKVSGLKSGFYELLIR
jgi:hypothetical protein